MISSPHGSDEIFLRISKISKGATDPADLVVLDFLIPIILGKEEFP
jgi:hypothetical protein